MNNEEIFYPDRNILDTWINFLKSENSSLKLKLPNTNDDWYEKILNTIERIKMPYIVGIHSKAAHLFYYLDKDHNFIDGNKRSSIVVTYLFYFINGYKILNPNRIKSLAKKVAKSRGSRNKDDWMEKIEKEFISIIKQIEI